MSDKKINVSLEKENQKSEVRDQRSEVSDQLPETIGAPEVPGTYTLSKDRTHWIPGDEDTKKKVIAYRKEYGDKAIKNIQIK